MRNLSIDQIREIELDNYLKQFEFEEIEVKTCECGETADYIASFYDKDDIEDNHKDEHICSSCLASITEDFKIYELELINDCNN